MCLCINTKLHHIGLCSHLFRTILVSLSPLIRRHGPSHSPLHCKFVLEFPSLSQDICSFLLSQSKTCRRVSESDSPHTSTDPEDFSRHHVSRSGRDTAPTSTISSDRTFKGIDTTYRLEIEPRLFLRIFQKSTSSQCSLNVKQFWRNRYHSSLSLTTLIGSLFQSVSFESLYTVWYNG